MDGDIAEALGRSTALSCAVTALVRTLARKGVLLPEEIATLGGEANLALGNTQPLHPDARFLAEAALKGLTQSWTKAVTKN